MRDEHLERLYDHLHTNGMGRGGAGRNRDWRAFFKALLLSVCMGFLFKQIMVDAMPPVKPSILFVCHYPYGVGLLTGGSI